MLRFVVCTLALALIAIDSGLGGEIYPGSADYQLAARNALVVGVPQLKDGNGFTSLKNPERDAMAVAAALRKVGFAVMNLNEVYKPQELTRQNIKLALYDYARVLQSVGGVGLIYFSGHGVEREGQIYLAPYDAYVRFERDLSEELIPVRLFYDAVEYAKNPLNLFVIDACRDNPWTKPLEQFGMLYQFKSVPASENVILANSALSGSRSPDGAGEKSPYAEAFVSSLDQADENLSDFFSAIGENLHELRQQHPEYSVPTIQQPAGREFIFVPTVDTYKREESFFNSAKQSGNRSLFERLVWKYSGGYFYKAAKTWLAQAPLAPVSPLPSNVIQLQGTTELRSAPSASSPIVETRTAGTQFVATALSDQKQYIAVDRGWKQEPAFVRSDQVRIAPVKNTRKSLKVWFNEGDMVGIGLLTEESVREIGAMGKDFAPSFTQIEVVGYEYSGVSSVRHHPLRLLLRQASVVEALSKSGYDSTKIAVRSQSTFRLDEDEAVRVSFWGSSLPNKDEFRKFDAEAFLKAQRANDIFYAGGLRMGVSR